jgi:hypothetical protein
MRFFQLLWEVQQLSWYFRHHRTWNILDLPGESGEHQLRNQEVFHGKREQTDAGVSA